jgi:hypothetical protein
VKENYPQKLGVGLRKDLSMKFPNSQTLGSDLFQTDQPIESRLYKNDFEWTETKSIPKIALNSCLPTEVKTIDIGNDLENK